MRVCSVGGVYGTTTEKNRKKNFYALLRSLAFSHLTIYKKKRHATRAFAPVSRGGNLKGFDFSSRGRAGNSRGRFLCVRLSRARFTFSFFSTIRIGCEKRYTFFCDVSLSFERDIIIPLSRLLLCDCATVAYVEKNIESRVRARKSRCVRGQR